MCNPLAIMAVGTAMQYKAQKDAERRANRQIGVGEDRNDVYNQNIINTIDDNAQQYDPQARQRNIEGAQDAAYTSLRDFLDRANEGRTQTDTTQGRVSEAFVADRAKRAIDNANQASVVARLMSKMRGVSDLQTDEAINNAGAASKVGVNAGQQINMARANSTDVSQAAQPNAGLMLAGAMASGYGMGKIINGYRTKTPSLTGTVGEYTPR